MWIRFLGFVAPHIVVLVTFPDCDQLQGCNTLCLHLSVSLFVQPTTAELVFPTSLTNRHLRHQSHSVATIKPPNGPEATDSNMSIPLSIMDSDDKELDEARGAMVQISVHHPDWLHRSRSLASLLTKKFEKTSEDPFLTECIGIQRQICASCTPGNPNRAVSASDLAFSLWTRCKQTGEESLLSESISLNREALSLRPTGHPDRSISCNGLALSLWTWYLRTGEQLLLIEAIDLAREALSLRPRGHPDRSISCNTLAVSLWTQFQQTGEESLLAEVTSLHREALDIRTSGHPDRFISCNNLANSLYAGFDQTGEESLLAEAVDLYREALSLQPKGHPFRSMLCNNLATSLLKLFNQTGEELLLTEVIDLHREALSLRPEGHPDRWMSYNNLANSLFTLSKQTGEEPVLIEAISFYREALLLLHNGHPDRSMACNNLAFSLWTLFKQTGEESLVADAIDLNRESLSLRPSGHPNRAMSCINLAVLLWDCFKRSGEESLLIEAINLNREALSLHTSGHPDRLETCNRLATSLKTRFDMTRDESLLFEAIDVCMETMKAQPQHHPSRWKPITKLVGIYLDRCFSQHNPVLAVDYLYESLSIPSHEWPTLLSEIAQLTSRIDLPTLPQESLSQLLQCFSAAIDLASRVAGFLLDPESQLQYLSSSQHLGPRAYWCAIACGQPQLGLELVERARAMIWTQALHMRTSQFSSAPPELAHELEVLLSNMNTSRVLEAPMGLTPTEQDVRHKNGARIHQLIQQIRAIPGQERFMRGLPFEELAQCAKRNAVVVLVAAEGRCHVLILRPHNQVPLTMELPHIKPDELMTMSSVVSAAHMRGSTLENQDHRMGMKLAASESSSQIHSIPVLEKLWIAVVKPVIDCLGLQKSSGSSRPRLHWCPTGAFMSLPLHAAGIYDGNNMECCADYLVCSYTPTLMALLRAQNSNPSFHREEAKLGLVAAMQAWNVDLPTLWHVDDEIEYVQAAVKGAGVSVENLKSYLGDAAIVTRVTDMFKNTNLVHVACHGKQNASNALSSGFCLSDGNLSVSQLMSLDLKDAFFAFLSACETAKGDEKQPDQIVHLAAAMLFVGFRSVVATMWAMDDSDGPLVAKLFYEKLFAEDVITLDAIPYALDYAVTELKKTGVPSEQWATFIHMGA